MEKHQNKELKKVPLNLNKVNHRPVYHFFKRGLDIVGSGLGLIVLSPVLGWVAYKVYYEDGGPVFYTQERVGKNGKPFKIYKFRSMIQNTDQMVEIDLNYINNSGNIKIIFKTF